MLVLAIFLTFITLIAILALLRIRVVAEYSDAGFTLWAKLAFYKTDLLAKDKKQRSKKVREFKEMMKGSVVGFMSGLKILLITLARVKHRLLIKQLTVHYTSAGEDPSETALNFGTANAIAGAVVPQLRNIFRIKNLDFRTWFDFYGAEPKVYVKAIITFSVWEFIYIIFKLMQTVTATLELDTIGKSDKINNKMRKDGEDDGKDSNQRVDGNNDAKIEGND